MVMEIPQLKSCFCFSLRTGAIIIAILEVLIYLLYFVDTTVMIIRTQRTEVHSHLKFSYFVGDILFSHAEILQILFAIILLIGIFKEKSFFVLTWILSAIARAFDVIWSWLLTSYYYFHTEYFIEQIIFIGITLMTNWVVFCYYRTMKKHYQTL